MRRGRGQARLASACACWPKQRPEFLKEDKAPAEAVSRFSMFLFLLFLFLLQLILVSNSSNYPLGGLLVLLSFDALHWTGAIKPKDVIHDLVSFFWGHETLNGTLQICPERMLFINSKFQLFLFPFKIFVVFLRVFCLSLAIMLSNSVHGAHCRNQDDVRHQVAKPRLRWRCPRSPLWIKIIFALFWKNNFSKLARKPLK